MVYMFHWSVTDPQYLIIPHSWFQAKPLLSSGEIKELVDPLLGNDYDCDEMERMMLVASLCTSTSAQSRLEMSQVRTLDNCLKVFCLNLSQHLSTIGSRSDARSFVSYLGQSLAPIGGPTLHFAFAHPNECSPTRCCYRYPTPPSPCPTVTATLLLGPLMNVALVCLTSTDVVEWWFFQAVMYDSSTFCLSTFVQ
jgi:hypothetical protein